MSDIAIILFWTLMGLVLGQGVMVCGFVWALWKWQRPLLSDAAAPKAAVILCLRGGDPFLGDCVRGLLSQDYPDYEVHVVIDHQDDPAHAILRQLVQQEHGERVRIQFLQNARETCSLKCSSVVQAASSLDESVHFIAQLDADTIPHTTWLRELATALSEERVGAATGNRWYMPNHVSLGSAIRYVWNSAAVVQMYWYGIAWGGTLAVKTQVLRETDLLEKWGHAFCEDTMLYAVLRRADWKVAFVPSLMMINREDCDVGGYYRWVRRQLLTARLYHPAWGAVLGHGVLTSIVPVLALAFLIAGLMHGNRETAIWSFAGLALYQTCLPLLIALMEVSVRRIASTRHEHTNWLSLTGAIKTILALPATQCVYFIALLSACLLRWVNWRGVEYEVKGPWKIWLLKYQPYLSKQSAPDESL
ncbi:MAG TPA: glycosyltransferase family 2 protein [Pirellulaceae bacterium]|nr:glycosyltransferase family 2 protein [Pirellulaceae bacterium]